jgi:integrase
MASGVLPWRTRQSDPWKYITKAKKADAIAAAENKLDEIETGGLIWSALPAARRRFLEAIHRDARHEDEAAVLAFLAAAILPQYRSGIVLQAFCGFRPEEIAPLKRKGTKKSKRGIRREEIDWQYNVIRVPGEVSKTSFPRNVPLLPAAREWLEWAGVHPGHTGPVCDENPVESGETARLGHEVFKTGWPQDALRHSYGSYRNAMIRSLTQVAEEMGTSETMMKQHYHNPKTKEEGEAWFGLHPSDLIRPKSDEIEVSARTFLEALKPTD